MLQQQQIKGELSLTNLTDIEVGTQKKNALWHS